MLKLHGWYKDCTLTSQFCIVHTVLSWDLLSILGMAPHVELCRNVGVDNVLRVRLHSLLFSVLLWKAISCLTLSMCNFVLPYSS